MVGYVETKSQLRTDLSRGYFLAREMKKGRLKWGLKKRSIFIDTGGVLGIILVEDVVNDVGKFYK